MPPEPRRLFVLERHRYAVLVAIGLVAYAAFLGLRSFWYPDEPDIAEVCLAMYESGDWITPRRNGVDWVDYPPFLYWAGCVFAHLLGGVSEFALRLPSAIGAILLAATTCAAATRHFGARAGLWSGVLLLTYVQFAFNATSYRTDMLLAVAAGIGTFAYAAGSGSRPSWSLRIAGFALLGIAVLVKGPVGLLLPGLVLTLYHAARREWAKLLSLAPLSLVAVAVATPWFLVCADAMGPDVFWSDIYGQNFRRFGEEQMGRGHIQPWHYYFASIWSDLAPWSLLLPFALAWIVRHRLWRDRLVQLSLWWFGASFVFWTIALTKRQLYLLPAYPAVAVLMGTYFAALAKPAADDRPAPADPRPFQVFVTAFWILIIVIGAASLAGGAALREIAARIDLDAAALEIAHAMQLPVLVGGAVALAGGLWVRDASRSHATPAALGRVAAVICGLYVVAFALVYPVVDLAKTYAPQCAWLREQAGDSDRIGLYYNPIGHHKKGAFAYYTGILVEVIRDESGLRNFFAEYPDSVAAVFRNDARALLERDSDEWRRRVLRELTISNRDYVILGGT